MSNRVSLGIGAFCKQTLHLKLLFSLIKIKLFFKLRKHCQSVSNFFGLSRIKISSKRFGSFLSRITFNNIDFLNIFCFELSKNLKTQHRTRFSSWKLPKRFMSITYCKLTGFVKFVFAKFTADLFLISETSASLKRNSLELIFLLRSKWSCIKWWFSLNSRKTSYLFQKFCEYHQYSDCNTKPPFLKFHIHLNRKFY